MRVFRLLTSQVFGKLITDNAVGANTRRRSAALSESGGLGARHSSGGGTGDLGSTPTVDTTTTGSDAGLPGGESNSEGDHDLRAHMVGILFSRSGKLTNLQKQVCAHILGSIRREATRVFTAWEKSIHDAFLDNVVRGSGGGETAVSSATASLGAGAASALDVTPAGEAPPAYSSLPSSSTVRSMDSDAYCFELLSMVLALSGSSVGRKYLAQQHPGLLKDLAALLHAGTPRVQRQVVSLLRRVLPSIPPHQFADVLGIPSLPSPLVAGVSLPGTAGAAAATTSTSTASDPTASASDSTTTSVSTGSPGILDIFLGCIAKALTVQMKVKSGAGVAHAGSAASSKPGVTTVRLHQVDLEGRVGLEGIQHWWMYGRVSAPLAEEILRLLRDMSNGILSEAWAAVAKSAVVETILNLTRLDDERKQPSACIRTRTIWLALSSLCIINQDHVARFSNRGSGGTTSATAAASLTPTSGEVGRETEPGAAGETESPLAVNSPSTPQTSRPTCDNHDDGETLAIIACDECGNLCGDCDRFLHLRLARW